MLIIKFLTWVRMPSTGRWHAHYIATGGGLVWVTPDYYPKLRKGVHAAISEESGELISWRALHAMEKEELGC